MSSEYQNISWHFFVYSSYLIVAVSLLFYSLYSIFSFKKSLQSMLEEGFFTNENAHEENTKNEVK